MYCKWCGAQNDHDAVFCSTCGKQVTRAGPTVAPPSTGEVDLTDSAATVEPPSTGEVGQGGAMPSSNADIGAGPAARRSRTVVPLLVVVVVALALMIVGVALTSGAGGETAEESTNSQPNGDAPVMTAASDVASNDPEPPSSTDPEPPSSTDPELPSSTDGRLLLGAVIPESGELAFLEPAFAAGLDLAVEDVNAAGGVGGVPIELVRADSGSDAPQAVAALVDGDVDGVVAFPTAASSPAALELLRDSGVLLVSSANVGDGFAEVDDDDLFFRTSPSTTTQGQALANLVGGDGHRRVVVLHADDPTADRIAMAFVGAFEDAGGVVEVVRPYDPSLEIPVNVERLRLSVTRPNSDAVILIGFAESAGLIDGFDELQAGPRSLPYYGASTNMTDRIGRLVSSPTHIGGMRGTAIGVDPDGERPDFTSRLEAIDPVLLDVSLTAEVYDAVVVAALAAEAAGTDNARVIREFVAEVTRDGERCITFDACRDLLLDGADIDYDGVSGPLDLTDSGEIDVTGVLTAEFSLSGSLRSIDS